MKFIVIAICVILGLIAAPFVLGLATVVVSYIAAIVVSIVATLAVVVIGLLPVFGLGLVAAALVWLILKAAGKV